MYSYFLDFFMEFLLCSKLTTKTSGRRHCSRSDVFIFNVEHICTNVSIVGMHNMYVCVDFEHIFLCWEVFQFLEIPYIEITITYKHGGFIGQKAGVIASYLL